MHGCVKASFKVVPDLPENLKVGVFAEPKEYNCWVRLSNASTHPKPDKKKDIRGLAIKLMSVPGEKMLKDELHDDTQDFLLMTHETFFSKNLIKFGKTMTAVTAKSKMKLILYFLNPMHWGLLARLMKSMKKCTNVLSETYWSTQPYRFGAPDKAVKYMVKPSAANNIINEGTEEDDYLRVNMSQTLNTNAVSFDFFVQFQTNADLMPIEDPTVPWTSTFRKVATLTIVKQDFDSQEQMNFGENLSFNSWHTLPAHRPLGSFNRARRVVYETMTKYRHKYNDLPVFEPDNSEDFLETPFKPRSNDE
jgi:catalase